jgi:hypothetical protein
MVEWPSAPRNLANLRISWPKTGITVLSLASGLGFSSNHFLLSIE